MKHVLLLTYKNLISKCIWRYNDIDSLSSVKNTCYLQMRKTFMAIMNMNRKRKSLTYEDIGYDILTHNSTFYQPLPDHA